MALTNPSQQRKATISHSITYLILVAGSIVVMFPLLWAISTSLKTPEQVTMTEINLIPKPVAWWNYVELFRQKPLPLYFRNTMVIVIAAEFGSLVVCSFVAYGFARISFPGRDIMLSLLLSAMMLPSVVTLVPLYIMFDRLKWVNTFLPLIVPRFLGHNAFYIFLMIQFFRGIPQDLTDAARIDGANEVGIWWRIAMPLSKPVLATIAVFTFQFAWNWFMQPLIYLGTEGDLWTLSLALRYFAGSEQEVSIELQMAMAILMFVPMVLIYVFGEKHLTRGVTFSGIRA